MSVQRSMICWFWRWFLLLPTSGYSLEAARVVPLRHAHAHNDYWHNRPLLDALGHGFCSFEADIYLVDGQLLVGHAPAELRPERTLQALYLEPIRQLARLNGGRLHPNGPECMLLVDIKTDGRRVYEVLRSVLASYRDVVSGCEDGRYHPRSVQVVISGDCPRQEVAADAARLAGIDGRLGDLDSSEHARLLPLISDRWTAHFRWRGIGDFPADEQERLRSIVQRAHDRGRRVRFWATPEEPALWQELLAAGVDHINTDQLDRLRDFLLAAEAAAIPARNTVSRSLAEAPRRVLLSAAQSRALAMLDEVRPQQPVPVILFTDPNKDPDDLNVLVMAKYLQQHGFITLRCVVTTLGDRATRRRRATFARGVLDGLGLEDVTVVIGGDYSLEVTDAVGAIDEEATERRRRDHQVFLDTPLLLPRGEVAEDGLAWVTGALAEVPDHAAVLLINAGMADPAALLRDAPAIVQQKVARVVIMGGVEAEADQRGFAVADKRAYNNSTHQPSADATYAKVQELGLPLVVVNREAAYAAAVSRDFFDGMAATGHPIGVYLEDQQKRALEHLWKGIHQGRLPPALTAEWFFATFTEIDLDSPAGKAAVARAQDQADDFESIWQLVDRFNLYDPLALLAAIPAVGELLFKGKPPTGARTDVQVVGQDSIKDPRLTKDLLAALPIEGLHSTIPRKSRTGTAPGYPPRQQVPESDAGWHKPLAGYAPPDYTAEVVFQHEGTWADPADVLRVRRSFLTRAVDGDRPAALDDTGRPLNPLGRTGLRGRGLLGRWGRNSAGDPLLTCIDPASGRLQVLVIERQDSGQQALPGGMVDEGEEIAATVARELREETGAIVDFADAAVLFAGVVDDPRNTDNAWMETTVLHKHLTPEERRAISPRAGDDARAVRWVDVDQPLLSSMYASHADYVRLALRRLREIGVCADQLDPR